MAACSNDVFKRIVKRWCQIEGSVKGDLEGSRQLDQLSCAFDIYSGIGAKYARDETARTQRTRMEKVLSY